MNIFNSIVDAVPLLLQGAAMTIKLWLCTACISMVVGAMFGIICSRRFWFRVVSPTISGFTFIFRAIPFYVSLLLVYFVLPEVIGFSFSAFSAGIISLGLCSSSYVCNIVRAGINSIPDGQWEAAYVLGFSRSSMLRYIILPQMMRNILPAFINELESILKSTSIISSIGVLELTRMGMNIVSREMNPLTIYCSIAIIYLLFSIVLILVGQKIERRLNQPYAR